MSQRLYYLLLAATLLLALALRVWGLNWGLPSATHYFSYHPDETTVLSAAMGMSVFRGQLLPHFYNYGSLQLYLVLIANTLDYLFGHGVLVIHDVSTQYAPWARMYLVGRALTVAMGVGTVWAVYALGTRLWSHRAGLLGAFVLAIMPLHAQQSHWLTVDVPATFWATLSLVWAARLATNDPKSLRAALLAGLFAGFAAATKYNLALVLLPLAFTTFRHFSRRGAVSFLTGVLAAIFAFLLTCPGFLWDSQKFWQDFRYEANHVQHLPGAEFAHTGSGFVYVIARNLDAGLGLPLLLLCLASIAYALIRRERGDGLLAAFTLPYYILISLAVVRYARYTIPLLPILALWIGRLLTDLSRLPHPFRRDVGIAAGALVLLGTLVNAGWLVGAMAAPDPRDQALAWLDVYAPAPMSIGFAVQPWFYTPPVSPWFCAPIPGSWRSQTSQKMLARIIYSGPWNTAMLPQAPYVMTTSFDDTVALPGADRTRFLATLNETHTIAVQFARKDLTGHIPNLPSDMAYPSPTITIYGPRP